ncbi:MAG: hypothetical protein B6245_07230 [Desulfobacteraceae bacterium 4572_88]|nr:MAG: hypothetical protein B6245_07230 [Desulfobacteraceae bacterium 4572_88]RLC09675.1 MAG: hypothetical protein DRI57_21695 [Deltaproteobacteria bacterium]
MGDAFFIHAGSQAQNFGYAFQQASLNHPGCLCFPESESGHVCVASAPISFLTPLPNLHLICY